jgi:uncharacterized protein (DUF362 family)
VLTSATRVLSTSGPDNGHVSVPGKGLVLASQDTLAHDMVSLAWLLEARAALPESVRSGPVDDPNESQFVANIANRIVTTSSQAPERPGQPRACRATTWPRCGTIASCAMSRWRWAG